MEKITIDTELLESLNTALAERESAIEIINKANTDEQNEEVKPTEIIGERFDSKDWCGEYGDEGEGTIAGCINTIGNEISEFVEGIIMVNDSGEKKKRSPSGGGDYYSPTEDPPVEETPQEETPQEETPEENPEDGEEEVVVVPVTPSLDSLVDQFDTGSDDNPGESNQYGVFSVTQDGAIITDENSEQIGTASAGQQYKVYEELKNTEGEVIAVRITPDGTEPEQWIRVNQENGPVGSYYEVDQVGSFNCTQEGIPIYDKDGNIIGNLDAKNYRVYAITTDNDNHVTAIRISKDGEPEQWVKIYQDGKYIDGGIFESYGDPYTNPEIQPIDDNSSISVNKGSSRNKILGGVLGVLVVGLGTTIYVKKKQANGETVTEEDALPEGDYNVYDYHTDDDGNITEAKISDSNSPEEQWVEF